MRGRMAATVGIGLIILGVLVVGFLGGWLKFDFLKYWPFILVGIGVLLHGSFVLSGSRETIVLMPGGMLIVYGLMFWICTEYGWSMLQVIYPMLFIGPAVSFAEIYFFGGQDTDILMPATLFGLIAFLTLLNSVFGKGIRVILPTGLILAGIFVALFSMRRKD